MEWTAAHIRLLRAVGLCLPQDKFAKELGFDKRTIGNAERGTHPPSLALRRALDHALANAALQAWPGCVVKGSLFVAVGWCCR
ncbi:MAG: helix-turn-helix domain-containing protein [Pseudonocardiales bacterium]